MQAIILAAGMGKRLKDLTANNTKCMVKVNGVTLIDRVLHQLDKLDLSKIVLVVGYEGQKLKDYIATINDLKTTIEYVDNAIYDKTNNIYSLALAKNFLLEDDTLLLESDLIFEDSVLELLLNDSRETLAVVDKYESWMDGTVVKLNVDDSIREFVPGKKFVFEDIPKYYKTVNIYKFSKRFSQTHYVPFLEAYTNALGMNEYYEQVLRVITMLDDPEIKALRLDGQLWYEIDDIQDLDIATSMFNPDGDEKVKLLQQRYGGYWRYPRLLDFCYLVNPYYPPERLKSEMKANFDELLTQYPSGMQVNSLLAAKNFGVKQEYILLGNGAAELIKEVMENHTGNIGFIRPTFEEYPNRYRKENSVYFVPNTDDFSYDEKDLMDYFGQQSIDMLVLINPDNPTGNYISKAGILKLAEWAKEKNIQLLVDESFVDFSDEEDSSILDNTILNQYKNLMVVKSISKSYGVPGVRLGILACGDTDLVSKIKKRVAIWNINSFGEFYMQIAEKYQKDYKEAIEKFRMVRKAFINDLKDIDGIIPFNTQANYVCCKLNTNMTSKELTKILLLQYNLLIKDLTSKMADGKEYIRLAVRKEEENKLLVKALREVLKRNQ